MNAESLDRNSAHGTQACPSCRSTDLSCFYEVRNVPVHSVLLMRTPDQAIGYKRGDVVLAFCRSCGFITNLAYDPSLQEYSSECEESQGFSPTFSSFQRKLAEYLINRYELREKTVLEIGCGKGEFLVLLCQLGNNKGIGFDPAYRGDRTPDWARGRVRFIQDFYSEKYTSIKADFVCCKMTLEHIHQTQDFMRTVRKALEGQPHATVFFQVPDVLRILKESAFWDIYYEHCSYFCAESLQSLFQRTGFRVLEVRCEFDNQYLLIVARPSEEPGKAKQEERGLEEVERLVSKFPQTSSKKIERWRSFLSEFKKERLRVALWGSGSKAVAFLTTLGNYDPVYAVVDINPFKQGTFLPGTGTPIIAPQELKRDPADVVIVMNPIYTKEIRKDLADLNLSPKVLEAR